MTKDKKLLRTGSWSTAIAAVCCFTPALVVLFGFAGLSAFVGWLDYGLFPMLFASMGVVAYALYLRSGGKGPPPTVAIVAAVVALSAVLLWLEFRYALRISIAAVVVVAAYAYYLRACDDYGLFPMLFASMGVVAYALYLRSGGKGPPPTVAIVAAVVALSAVLLWLEFRYALRISIAAVVVVAAYAYYLRACVRRQNSQLADSKETLS